MPLDTNPSPTRHRQLLSTIEEGVRSTGDRLIDAYPVLARPVLRAWYGYVYLSVRAANLKCSLGHRAPIDPFGIYWVDPDRIECKIPPFPESKFKYAGRVAGGDWDRHREPFEETDVYRAFEAHFERDVAWDETAFFDRVVGEIESGRSPWGCRSRAEFEARCDRLDQLYESIRVHGYKTQAELARGSVAEPVDKGRVSTIERLIQDEMTISVGREGDLLFNDGRDRLAIAKVLDLDEIPVWIMLRHRRWQEFRDDVYAGEIDADALSGDLRTHPDLP